MSSTAQWSLKSLPLSAIINCSAQEYDTPLTTNDEGDHCEKKDGGCQNNTTLSVEYSREGSNTDGANRSEAVLAIWACNVPVREYQASATWARNVPFREHQASAVLSCNVPVREHQVSAVRASNVPVQNTRPRPFRPAMSPSGNTRVRPFGPVMSPFGTPGLGITMRGPTHGLSRRVPVAHRPKTARSCF